MGIERIIKKIVIGRNPGNNTADNLGETGEVHNFCEQDDYLESVYYEEILNQKCGCFAPAGGRCSECGAISCIRCHQHCGGTENPSSLGCGKPLCREHCHYLTLSEGKILPLCKQCFSKITRKLNRQKACRLLLSPFIEQEADNEQ